MVPLEPFKKIEGLGAPLDFYENRSIDTVFHADYNGAIFVSPHSKLWHPEASKDFLGVGGTPQVFIKVIGFMYSFSC